MIWDVFWSQIFDFDGLVECIAMLGTLMSIFEWKHSRGKMFGSAAVFLALFFLCNTAVILANELYGTMSANIRFVLYVVLIVGAGFCFAVLCLKGFWQQFLVTLLFFKDCVLFVSFLYKSWVTSTGDSGWIQAVQYLLGVVMILLAALLCKQMSSPIHIQISAGYWCISILTPIFLLLLWQQFKTFSVSVNDTTVQSSIPINTMMLAISFASYALFIRLAQELEGQMDLRLTNQSLAYQMRQMDSAQVMLEQARTARHELKNNYFYMETLLKQKKYDEIQQFLDQMAWSQFERQEMVSTGNQLIDMILSQKVAEARQHDIPIVLDVLLPKELRLRQQILCSLLFNLLDNAIEASQKENAPDIYFAMREKKGYLSIEIRNKIKSSVLQGNPELQTSKSDKDSHGIGMKLIRQIVDSCDGNLDILEDNGWFVVSILLPESAE